ncbi:GFA family protein [Myxosarcina sp. GI1(2024)]
MTGSCVCGAIVFEVTAIPGVVFNCHCTRCRKSHGAAFATQAFAVRKSLNFIRGEEYLKEYESTKGIRTFCSICGSRLMNYAKDGADYLSVALSCIDSPHQEKPIAHAFVANKAGWHQPSQDIPSYSGLPTDFM